MRRADLLALAERVEKAAGADREVDAEIEAARGWPDVQWTGEAPRYTASIDAAAALVPAGWDAALYWGVEDVRPEAQLETEARRERWLGPVAAAAATPALALTAAALRARAEEMRDE